TAVWQKVDLADLSYESAGRHVAGPGGRFRTELHPRVGGTEGTWLAVSDGAHLWEATRVGGGGWTSVSRLDLREVSAALEGPAVAPALRANVLGGLMVRGPAPLLRDLRGRLSWVGREAVRTAGGERVRLTGVWPPAVAAMLAP